MQYRCRQPDCDWVSDDRDTRQEAFADLRAHQGDEHPDIYSSAGRRKRGKQASEELLAEDSERGGAAVASRPADSGRTSPYYPFRFSTRELRIDPVVALRYETWRQQAAYGGSIEEWINECTEIVTLFAGLVPRGYYLEEPEGEGTDDDGRGDPEEAWSEEDRGLDHGRR
jgi:hypothetical protein